MEEPGRLQLMGFCKESDTPEPLSLVIWRLRLLASAAGGMSSIPGLGTKIPACRKAQPKS